MSTDLSQRLVSHRMRGFSANENSLSALDAALSRGVPYIEIDTRVTADGELLVFHDARLDPMTRQEGRVADYRVDAQGMPRFPGGPGEALATLEQFLARFAAASDTAQLLIDVKDPGSERGHCTAIEKARLEDRVRVMSWWPEVLLAVHAIQPGLRLVLSFVPLGNAPWWLQSVRLFGNGSLIRRLGRLRGKSRQARYMQDTVFRREPLAADGAVKGGMAGRYPVCFTEGLPDGDLAAALTDSGGGIATWPRVIDRQLVDQARAQGLEVISFSLNDRRDVEHMLHGPGPALVFTNNVELFREPA